KRNSAICMSPSRAPERARQAGRELKDIPPQAGNGAGLGEGRVFFFWVFLGCPPEKKTKKTPPKNGGGNFPGGEKHRPPAMPG
ncbi:hypothetical protein, partial [Cronobacter sakazakii]|uniref:hypothetical protein n=1 Tax=Cronobacter sakazakii TaxID=28141 RepID=UPI000D4EF0F6